MSKVSTQHQAVADRLLLIERELRVLQWWSETAPELWRLQSSTPFCIDTLQLEEWLQWIFLPRMKMLVEQGASLPQNCAIVPIAELSWRERDTRQCAALMQHLQAMDQLLAGQPGG